MKLPPLKAGQALLVATVIFLVISLTVIFGLIGPVVKQLKISRQLIATRQSFFLAEAGVEDVTYRLTHAITVDASESLSLNGITASTAVTDTFNGKDVESTGTILATIRKVKAQLVRGEGVIFKFGTQAGQGGFVFKNNSHVDGSLYSNGPIVGANGAYITGDAFVAGESGSISNMRIGYGGLGHAHAYSVTSSTVTGNIYCQSGSGNNKQCYSPPEELPPTEDLPIPDEDIEAWKVDAEAGGVDTGNVTVSTPTTIGPKKIVGDLTVNSVLTIADTIYVTGNLIINGTVKLGSTYGASSGMIIADGYIIIGNGVVFQNSGTSGSYILILSTSNCDASMLNSPCLAHNAIDVSNNSSISIVNAQKGTVYFSNNAGVKEAVGNKIELKNNVGISYGSGLINVGFSSGPSGGYQIISWGEVE